MIAASPTQAYEPLAWLIAIVLLMAAAMFGAAHMLGPRRMGPVKGTPYEAGVLPISSPRTRFDIRFYMVAMIFLLFDVEVALLWPWATLYVDSTRTQPGCQAAQQLLGRSLSSGYLFGVVAVFVAILLIGYVYAWRKGVFKFS